MLKVTFWSSSREKGGVTSNMLAVAMVISQYFHMKVGIRSFHISNRMVDYYISDIDHRVAVVASDTESYSRDFPQYMHYLLKYDDRFYTKRNEKRRIGMKKETAVNLYRPPEVFEEEIFQGDGEELMLLDLSGKKSPECYRVMDEADINVIMLTPNMDEIKAHFSAYPAGKKNIYVINGYTERCEYSPKIMRTILHDEFGVKRGRMFFIPYYEKLRRACHLGEVDKLLESEIKARKMSLYFRSVKEVGKKLLICKARQTQQ